MSHPSVEPPSGTGHRLQALTLALFDYCQSRNWAGYDPYDALNSKLFEVLPALNRRAPRLLLTHLLKRSPLNLRPLLRIPPSQNPKGLALFLRAALKLHRLDLVPTEACRGLLEALLALRSKDYSHWCWGYPFAWQSRAALFPRWLPNIICTTFAANALLDAYEEFGENGCLQAAISAADFLQECLYYEEGPLACFSYMPLARSKVHNANLLGAAFLCRVAGSSRQERYLAPALKAARFSVGCQHPDGSWDYGDSDKPPQRWKDNFHTGFNLVALRELARSAGTTEFDTPLLRGFEFFISHFLGPDGAPHYFHDRVYPLDIHSAAQSILTLLTLQELDAGNRERAQRVLYWALDNLYSGQGYFYFQKLPLYVNRIAYMRWSQAWMLLALSSLLEQGLTREPQPYGGN